MTRALLALAAMGGLAVGSAGQDAKRLPLVQRLAEDWRWRELEMPNEVDVAEHLRLDGDDRPVVVVNGRVLHYDCRWHDISSASGHGAFARGVMRCGSGLAAWGDDGVFMSRDGGAFEPLNDEHGEQLESDFLVCLGEGRALMSTEEALLLLRDGEVREQLPRPADGAYTGACYDRNGRMLLCAGDELWIQDGAGGWELLPDVPSSDRPQCRYRMLPSGDDVLLVPMRSMAMGPVLRWDGERLVEDSDTLPGGEAVVLDGRLVVADWVEGLLVSDDAGQWQHVPIPIGADPRLMLMQALPDGGLLALSSRGKVWVCDLGSDRWRVHTPPGDRWARSVHAISRSAEGGFWIATGRCVQRFEDGVFSPCEDAAVDREREYTTVLEDSKGRVWAGGGSAFAGVVLRERAGGPWRRVEEPFGGRCVHAVRELADGSVWFFLLGPVLEREITPSGEAAIGPGGIVRLGRDGEWTHWTVADGLPHERCYDAVNLHDGRIVAATMGGMATLEGDRWVPMEYRSAARVLHVDPTGTLWVGRGMSTEGAACYRDGRWVDVPPGLARRAVGSWADHPDGGLWIASPSGLYKLDDNGLHPIGNEPGRPVRSFWPALAEADGSIWLGGHHGGLVHFRPDDQRAPQLRSLRMEPSGDAWLASWTANDARDETAAPSLRFRWRVDDGPWSQPVSERSVLLDDLEPGEHGFDVMVLDRSGNSVVASSEPFTVRPPLWRRPLVWAGLIGLLGLVTLTGTAVVRWRQQVAGERQRVARSELHFRQVVGQVGALFARFDGDGALTWADPSFQRLAGDDRVRGLDDLPRLFADDSAACVAMLQRAREGHPGSAELSRPDGSGLRRWFLAHLVPHEVEAGAGRAYDLAALDVTERKLSEQHRAELAAWRHQNERLEAVGHLAAGIAHDFNNLLTAILGNQTLLARRLEELGVEDPKVAAKLGATDDAARRAAELTSRLLRFSRQDMSRPRSLDVGEALRGMEGVLRRLIREDIDIVWQLAPALSNVWLDPSELEQVVLNLAINARDAMPGGGQLLISAHEEAEQLVLRVADTGVGMDEATLKRIFDPFFTTKELGSGTGLGLATVHRIVQGAGGRVRVRSELGAGTTFELQLPVQGRDVVRAPRRAPEAVGGDEVVVLCEDDLAVRDMIAIMLGDHGYDVRVSESVDDALELLDTVADVQLLVTDVIMPSGSGPELVAAARIRRPELAVLYVSGYPAHLLDGTSSDDELLAKPFTEAELLARVREALDGRIVISGPS